uniref:Uncharacterized protein n=1 Tax=Chlamydomonas leiostraca TaxID=1034604 RepID=A0A6T8Q018_9CHLO|mmetsp:Transcript_14658/g.36527  ORF Transcript_14658/g.36527 Transcript_14658/m.36527 type:complete len:108 (+) Transcript_14658:780-1103(+)
MGHAQSSSTTSAVQPCATQLSSATAAAHSRARPMRELGASILKDLHSQRETIVHSSNTLRGADDNITKARKILSNMARRLMQNKIIMAGVILFLVAAIALIIWAKVR